MATAVLVQRDSQFSPNGGGRSDFITPKFKLLTLESRSNGGSGGSQNVAPAVNDFTNSDAHEQGGEGPMRGRKSKTTSNQMGQSPYPQPNAIGDALRELHSLQRNSNQ